VRTVRTTIESEIGVIDRDDIRKLWDNYPELKDCLRKFAKRIHVRKPWGMPDQREGDAVDAKGGSLDDKAASLSAKARIMEGHAPIDKDMTFTELMDAAKTRGCEDLVETALDSRKALVYMLESQPDVAKKDAEIARKDIQIMNLQLALLEEKRRGMAASPTRVAPPPALASMSAAGEEEQQEAVQVDEVQVQQPPQQRRVKRTRSSTFAASPTSSIDFGSSLASPTGRASARGVLGMLGEAPEPASEPEPEPEPEPRAP
jgi:hypothetical protein